MLDLQPHYAHEMAIGRVTDKHGLVHEFYLTCVDCDVELVVQELDVPMEMSI